MGNFFIVAIFFFVSCFFFKVEGRNLEMTFQGWFLGKMIFGH